MNICGLLNVPDIPTEILTEYPYAAIVEIEMSTGDTGYLSLLSKSPFYYAESGKINGHDQDEIISLNTEGAYEMEYSEEVSEWTNGMVGSGFCILGSVSVSGDITASISVIWSNHDVFKVNDVNSSTGEFTVDTEIYFHEYQNFNGVWLPKIPEDITEKNPYQIMVLITSSTLYGYALVAADKEFMFGRVDVVGALGFQYDIVASLGAGTNLSIDYYEHEWTRHDDTSVPYMPITEDFNGKNVSLFWANHDIYEVTSIDASTMDYTTGNLYFPNSLGSNSKPIRYSIAGAILEDIASQIRRLTITEDKIKPEDMEPMLESVQSAPELPYAEEVEFG
jgi:hypothetical protein